MSWFCVPANHISGLKWTPKYCPTDGIYTPCGQPKQRTGWAIIRNDSDTTCGLERLTVRNQTEDPHGFVIEKEIVLEPRELLIVVSAKGGGNPSNGEVYYLPGWTMMGISADCLTGRIRLFWNMPMEGLF